MCTQWKGEHREKWLSNVWTEHGKKVARCMGRTREEKWLSGVWTEHESNKRIGPEWDVVAVDTLSFVYSNGSLRFRIAMLNRC